MTSSVGKDLERKFERKTKLDVPCINDTFAYSFCVYHCKHMHLHNFKLTQKNQHSEFVNAIFHTTLRTVRTIDKISTSSSTRISTSTSRYATYSIKYIQFISNVLNFRFIKREKWFWQLKWFQLMKMLFFISDFQNKMAKMRKCINKIIKICTIS